MKAKGGSFPAEVRAHVDAVAKSGGTPLVVAEGATVLGVIQLKDIVKGGIKERFAELRKMGIKTVMITGDNPLTAGGHRRGSGRRRLPGSRPRRKRSSRSFASTRRADVSSP